MSADKLAQKTFSRRGARAYCMITPDKYGPRAAIKAGASYFDKEKKEYVEKSWWSPEDADLVAAVLRDASSWASQKVDELKTTTAEKQVADGADKGAKQAAMSFGDDDIPF